MKKISKENNEFIIKYAQYSSMIYKISLLYLKVPMDCEDIMQEVFIKLLTKNKKFMNQEHEKRWVLRTTVNCCIDKLRKLKKRKTLPLNENIIIIESNEENDLIEVVFQLPEKVKAPIHLYYYEGYKINEIAKILGISMSAVKMRLKRGREMLKIRLEDEQYEV